MKYLNYLLVFVPLAIIAEFAHWDSTLILVSCSLGMVPLAGLMGQATESLADITGPKVGGFLNATLGNAAELIITIVALQAGKVVLVQASIIGSILGNLLLIMGLSILLGGLKHGVLRFDRTLTGVNSSMMLLATVGLIVPSALALTHAAKDLTTHLNAFSLWVSGVLLFLYILSLVFTFRHECEPEPGSAPAACVDPLGTQALDDAEEEASHHGPAWGLKTSLGVLAGSTLLIVALSEFLVGAIEPVVHRWGISEFFIGIILVPIVGNVAEHVVGVQMALKNRMDLSLAISLGSSTQIALFVAPVLVFLSVFVGPQMMNLQFHTLEVVSLSLAGFLAAHLSLDGESHWLEGALLLAVYAILGFSFYYYA